MNFNIIKETTCKSIGIGYIVRCQSNDSIGIIYGARNSGNCTQLTDDSIVKMFFFKKDNQTEYPPYTIISYLQESETCSYPDKTIEVTNVIPLDNFIIYDESADFNEQKREDGCYHCDLEWKLMSEAKPYAELSHIELCINLPYIHPKEKMLNIIIIACTIGKTHQIATWAASVAFFTLLNSFLSTKTFPL